MTKNSEIHNPLVSIVVITYNSAKYVLETLESAKAQTYQNVELIITDDCSTDNTVAVCREWLEKNEDRFVKAELVTSPCNTGVPANLNRGVKKAQGVWIKNIAGDDILVENSIEEFLKKYEGNRLIVAGQCYHFQVGADGRKRIDKLLYPLKNTMNYYKLSAEEQYKRLLLKEYFLVTPTLMVKRELYEKVGLYDEKYRLMEDYPFLLKCFSRGYGVDFVPVVMVYYRHHSGGITSFSNKFYNEPFYQCLLGFNKNEVYPRVSKMNLIFWQNVFVLRVRHRILYTFFKNKRNKYTLFISRVILLFSIRAVISVPLKWDELNN